ncbi:MAG: L,D-transpeptidase family protein [bacterium]|nr:L,D-transpeptidase family protein [bacterium]
MKRPSIGFCLTLAILLGLLVFYRYGRSIWVPIKLKIAGKRTVDEVLIQLEDRMKQNFPDIELLTDGQPLSLLAFKEEWRLEVWKMTHSGWRYLKTYPFTAFSGRLGPKLREGDFQIPEGIYAVEYLNPNSRYHLSVKINYPNNFDREKAQHDQRTQLGGDVFIHGMNATIGCIPIGNTNIEELFYLVAKNGYQNTQVIISPYDMRVGTKALYVEKITWEDELYMKLSDALTSFLIPGGAEH